jgi:O-antigen/teichoic acid export membrane protein
LFWSKLSAEKKAGLFGIGWTTLAHLITLCLRMGSLLVLTRILLPDAYGLFGAALSTVLILNLVTDLGVRPGLMRHPQGMTPEFLGTGWIIGFRRGILIALILVGFSFVLPEINGVPQTGNLLRVLALSPLLHSLQSPTLPMLYFQMRYRELSLIEIGQFIAQAGAGIVAALILKSEWALVIGVLANELTFVLLSHYYSPKSSWPRWYPHVAAELRHFSISVFINTLVMALWMHSDRVMALNFITKEQLGLYINAWALTEIVDRLMSRITDVYYSMLTRNTDEASRTAMQRKVSEKIGLFLMPLMMIGILLAPLAIRLFYREEYQGAQILFALLMARQMLRTLGMVQFQYFLIRGEVSLATRCYFIALTVQLLAFFPLIIHFGAVGMAWAGIASTGAYTFSQGLILMRRGEMGIMPYLLTLFWMAVGIVGVNLFWFGGM